jgi:Flp pilus assembly protein TadD
MQLNQLEEARTILEQLVLLQPKEEQTQNNLGYLMVLDGRAPQAKAFLLRAIKLNQDYVKALENIVSWEINFGEKQQAIIWINTLLKLDPKNVTYNKIKVQISTK